jgi:sugar O-acyltransferase (sialic acid O-acetyltransferase NeuD family)
MNVKSPIVVLGASGHALVVADILRLNPDYEIAGFLDGVHPERKEELFAGAPILGGDEQLEFLFSQGISHAIVSIGNNQARLKCAEMLINKGFKLARAIHPSAVIARDVVIGAGTVVAASAVINPGVKIGQNVIVNTSASIDHECQIADSAHVGTGVRLGAGVQIGVGASIAIGSIVAHRVRIGDFACVETGTIVLKDIPPSVGFL